MTSTIKITATQKGFLEDRLSLSCAISEALDEEGFTEVQVIRACESLLHMTARQRISADLTPVERAVLTDAIEGSTVLARMKAAQEFDQYKGYSAVARSVRALIGNLRAIGIEADMPSGD